MGLSDLVSQFSGAIRAFEQAGFERFFAFVNGPDARFVLVPAALVAALLFGLRASRTLLGERAWHLTLIRFFAGHVIYLLASITILFLIGSGLVAYLYTSAPDSPISAAWSANFWAHVASKKMLFLSGAGVGVAVGFSFIYLWGRFTEPALSEWLAGRTKTAIDDRLTDVREIERILPQRLEYEPEKYFRVERDQVFFGLDEHRRPIHIARENWKKTHVQIVGTTGFGKGVQAGVVLTQSVLFEDAVFVFDPKDDEWLPSVLAAACRMAGKPFIFIDLRAGKPAQINPLHAADAAEVAGLFDAVFELGDTGEASDFYRANDRRALRVLAQLAEDKTVCIPELADQFADVLEQRSPDLAGEADGLYRKLEELARLSVIQTAEGGQIEQIISGGGCLYIVGDTLDEQVIKLQKMLFVRLVQLIRKRPRGGRHVTAFLDEFKYLISGPVINAFGVVRDRGMNLMLAHQTNKDFHDCAGLRPQAVEGAILDNTALKWIYQTKDLRDAERIAGMTGKILVKTERGEIERNAQLSEHIESERTFVETERNKYDSNMIQNLPPGCAVVIGAGQARLAFASPVRVEKQAFAPAQARPYTPASGDPFAPPEAADVDEAASDDTPEDNLL